MPNVVVKPHVDTFMKSDDSSDALNSIGALPEAEFAGLSATFATDVEFIGLSANYLLKTEFAGLSTTFSQGSLPTTEFAGLSATLLPKVDFAGLSATLLSEAEYAGLSAATQTILNNKINLDGLNVTNRAALLSAIAADPKPWGIPGCVAAYDANNLVLTGTPANRVSQWNDYTGNGYHLSFPLSGSGAAGVLSAGAVAIQGGIYVVGNGGIPNLDSQNQTIVCIGREWISENPNNGTVSNGGTIYLLGSGRPRLAFSNYFSTLASNDTYGPPPMFSPNGGPSLYAQVCGANEAMIYVNGNVVQRLGFSQTTNTLTHVFGQSDGFGTMFRPIIAFLVYNRKLTQGEISQIASYYGAPTKPASTAVYCFGSSTPLANRANQYQNGCVQLFSDSIGADRNIYAFGGASWNGFVNGLNTTNGTIQVPRGQRNIHVFIPQTNDLASGVTAQDCITALSAAATRIRTVSPTAEFLFCPITPRNTAFTGGSTYESFMSARNIVNNFMLASASNYWGVCCDIMSISAIMNRGDEANTLYFDPDQLHLNTAGHLEYAKSMYRAYTKLNTDATLYTTLANISGTNIPDVTLFRTSLSAGRKPSGPYNNALEASRAGAPYNEPFFTLEYDYKLLRAGVSAVAFLGDSVTSQGTLGQQVLGSANYGVWARDIMQTKWNFAYDSLSGNSTYGVGGSRSDQLVTSMLPALTANPKPNLTVIAWGINDVQQTAGSIVSLLTSSKLAYDSLRNSGKFVIQTTVIPPLVSLDQARAQKLYDANVALRQQCVEYNIPLCDWTLAMSISSGALSANPLYMSDNLHPNAAGASIMGRELAKTMEKHFDFTIDNYSPAITCVSENFGLSGVSISATPTSWLVFPPAGGTISSRSISASPQGNWWTFDLYKGTATSYYNILTFTNSTKPLSNTFIDGYFDFEVLSGAVACGISVQVYPSNAQVIFDQSAGHTHGVFLPEDGQCALRTPAFSANGGITGAYPSVLMTPLSTNASVRIRNLSVRIVPFSGQGS